MRIFTNESLPKILKDRYIYLDNDFLSEIFSNQEDVFIDFRTKGKIINILIDYHIEFEFLRDVFLPEQIKLKEDFLSTEIFIPSNNHPEVLKKIQENALILSKIYAHCQKSKEVGYVDLQLAARIMFQHSISLLITGNKKHYPCVFDTLNIINIEQEDNTVQSYYVLSFNYDKFTEKNRNLSKITR